jgi:hypothetical protein
MNPIELNYLNFSNQSGNPDIIIFQASSNDLTYHAPSHIAWRVIQNCGRGWSFPFTFSFDLALGITDPTGNISPPMAVSPGQMLDVVQSPEGTDIVADSSPTEPGSVSVSNKLKENITVRIYRDNKVITSYDLSPFSTVTFKYASMIGIATATTQATEGSMVMHNTPTILSLDGISKADIILTGGGESGPLQFALANQVRTA